MIADAETDRLTGPPDARAWERPVDEARAAHERLGDPTAVLWLDVRPPSTSDRTPTDAYRLAAATRLRIELDAAGVAGTVTVDVWSPAPVS